MSCPSFARGPPGNDHPANDHITALGIGIEQPGVCHQLVVLPAHQVQGIATEVLSIDVLIGAFLLDDKYLERSSMA